MSFSVIAKTITEGSVGQLRMKMDTLSSKGLRQIRFTYIV